MKNSTLYSRIKRIGLWLGVFVLLACGPGLYDEDEFLSYFAPETSVNSSQLSYFHFSPSFLYNMEMYWTLEFDSLRTAGDDNLAAWMKRVGGSVSMDDIGVVLYSGNDTVNAEIRNAIASGKAYRSRYPFVTALASAGRHDDIKYLRFALDVDKAQPKSGSWYEEGKEADSASLASYVPLALQYARAATDPYLKERYAFQAIKVMGTLRMLDDEIRTYDEFFSKTGSTTPMRYWAESRMAGAYLILGDTARSIYHFGQVFQNCPSRQYEAYLSLRINQVKFNPKAISYCKNSKEKAAVYALCGVQPWQESLDILNGMLADDPSDSLMRLVFAREINKTEYTGLSDSDNPEKYWYYYFNTRNDNDSVRTSRTSNTRAYFGKLLAFAKLAAENEKVPEKSFWLAAAAYLSYVTNDFEASKEYITEAEDESTSGAIKQQITLQKLLIFANTTTEMTSAKEEEVIPLLESLKNHSDFRSTNAFVYSCQKISDLYLSSVEPKPVRGFIGCATNNSESTVNERDANIAKAFLFKAMPTSQIMNSWYISQPDLYTLEDSTPSAIVESTIRYMSSNDMRDYDKRLQKISGIDLSYLYKLKGTRALAEQKYDEAFAAFTNVADSTWNEHRYSYLDCNPLATGILDSHGKGKADTITFTPLTFAKAMQALLETAHKGGPEAADAYFKLGAGAYNMSAWGNSWILLKRSWTSADELGTYYSAPLTDSTYYKTIVAAEKYFVKAMEQTTDVELAARACFMAAKCEQKRFYFKLYDLHTTLRADLGERYYSINSDSLDSHFLGIQRKDYRVYFDLLKTKYAATALNKEALQECGYYSAYAQGK